MRPIIKPKKNKMKKLFAILAVGVALTACNGSGDDKAANADSTKNPAADAAKMADTANKMMDTAHKMMDKMADTASKMMDKAADKMKDASKMVKEAPKH